MKNHKKSLIVAFPIVFVAIIILGCAGSQSSSSQNSVQPSDNIENNLEEPNVFDKIDSQAIDPKKEVSEEGELNEIENNDESSGDTNSSDASASSAYLNIGDEATVDNLKIQVLDYKFSDYADGEGRNKVQDGLRYCVVYLKVKNMDNASKDLGNSFNRAYTTKLLYDNNYSYLSTWTKDPKFFFANDSLPALGEIDCIVTYEVAKDVEDNPDKELTFTFEINDIWKDTQSTTWKLR